MPLTLRLRFEGRAATLSGILEDMTIGKFKVLLAEKTGVPPDQQSLKCGFPPAPLKEFGTLAQAGCVDRDTIILEKRVATADDDADDDVLLISSSGGPASFGKALSSGADQNVQTAAESSAAKRPRQTSTASAVATPLAESSAAKRPRQTSTASAGATPLAESSAAKRLRQTSTASAGATPLAHATSSTAPGSSQDPRGLELVRAFERAICVSEEHVRMLPEDKHQLFALRKGKSAVVASLKQGNEISLSALHTLTGVGHWVVEQVKYHVMQPAGAAAKAGPFLRSMNAGCSSKPAPSTTPNSFQWWYVGKNGKPVDFRNDAQVQGPLHAQEFRVGIMHSSGRLEKAYLPDAKAPPRCPPLPAVTTGK